VFETKQVIPAVRQLKDLDRVFELPQPYLAILETHVAQLRPIVERAKKYHKKVLLHADLVQGLKNDEAAAEFLCQEIRPAGLISTRANVLGVAKKKGLITIQRLFLLDSLALETSLRTFNKIQPDIVEVLPGLIPSMVKEIRDRTNVPVITGGLIRTEEEVKLAFEAGASAVTTSLKNLWGIEEPLKA
jgi:glycerol uptake operon antiterminator